MITEGGGWLVVVDGKGSEEGGGGMEELNVPKWRPSFETFTNGRAYITLLFMRPHSINSFQQVNPHFTINLKSTSVEMVFIRFKKKDGGMINDIERNIRKKEMSNGVY